MVRQEADDYYPPAKSSLPVFRHGCGRGGRGRASELRRSRARGQAARGAVRRLPPSSCTSQRCPPPGGLPRAVPCSRAERPGPAISQHRLRLGSSPGIGATMRRIAEFEAASCVSPVRGVLNLHTQLNSSVPRPHSSDCRTGRVLGWNFDSSHVRLHDANIGPDGRDSYSQYSGRRGGPAFGTPRGGPRIAVRRHLNSADSSHVHLHGTTVGPNGRGSHLHSSGRRGDFASGTPRGGPRIAVKRQLFSASGLPARLQFVSSVLGSRGSLISPKGGGAALRACCKGMLNGTPRFAGFLRSWLSPLLLPKSCKANPKADPRNSRGYSGLAFACPLSITPGPHPKGRGRAMARWRLRAVAATWALLMLGWGVFLAVGRRRLAPADLPVPETPAALAVVGRAARSAFSFVRRLSVASADFAGGRRGGALPASLSELETVAAAAVELHRNVSRGAYAPGPRSSGDAPYISGVGRMVAMPIVPSRVALPAKAATLDISPFLTPPVLQAFLSPQSILRENPPEPAAAKVHATPRNWDAFLARLDESDSLDLVLEEDRLTTEWGPSPPAGYFSVAKDAQRDRTICNRIPRNALERKLGLCGSLMAHGSSLVDFHLEPGQVGRFSTKDLENYYHLIAVSEERTFSNCIGPPVPVRSLRQCPNAWGRLVRRVGRSRVQRLVDDGGVAFPAQRTLPMGDVNAVDIAQAAHMNLLRRGGCLGSESLFTYRRSPPRGDLWEGVVVDDYAILMRASSRVAGAEDPDVQAERAAEAAYATSGATEHKGKRKSQITEGVLWGAYLDGVEGWTSAAPDFIIRTISLTCSLLSLGCYTADLLSALLGCWAHILLFRRVGFAFLGQAYAAARSEPSVRVFPLPSAVSEELCWLVSFAPLLGTNLRASWGSKLWAGDASSYKIALVSSAVPEALVRELWRLRYRKGGYVRPSGGADLFLSRLAESPDEFEKSLGALFPPAVESGGDFLDASGVNNRTLAVRQLVNELMDGLGWKREMVRSAPPSLHINIKEARAERRLVSNLLSDSATQDTRHVYVGDSDVALSAHAKGRSPSTKLNTELRKGTCEQLLGGIYLADLHTSSECNPSDDPTRGRPVRVLPKCRQQWLCDILEDHDAGAVVDSRLAELGYVEVLPEGLL